MGESVLRDRSIPMKSAASALVEEVPPPERESGQ